MTLLEGIQLPHDKELHSVWYDGQDLSREGRAWLQTLIESADIMLVLLSNHSALSPYFTCREMREALKLQEREALKILPVVLHTCWWEDSIFKDLEILPRGGLPIYDSPQVKSQLFEQVMQRLSEEIKAVAVRKRERWESFAGIVREANQYFQSWEVQPELLQKAIPLYEEALEHWYEGFSPDKEWLEQRIEICHREIDFRHYARSAREAYQAQDWEAVFFNCKDALRLRNDAEIGKMYAQVEAMLEAEKIKTRREPFEKHLKEAHALFLRLDWQAADAAFQQALGFWEEGFEPHEKVIRHKMDICRREYRWEQALKKSDELYYELSYAPLVQNLMDAIHDINRPAFNRVRHIMDLMEMLENAEPFRDARINRWGFLDRRNNQTIIAPKYEAAYAFSEGLAGVKKFNKWGFIDIEGREIIPFEYNFVGHFKKGLAEVFKGSDAFLVDRRGRRT